jgi:putative tryptophan/tyrosine transport system substrate-binding protein
MRRREFITLIGGATAWPLAARAQPTSPKRVGFLLVGLSPESKEVQVFRRELRKAGYIEGRNLVLEWRSANGDYDRVPALVADLIQSNVDVMVHDSTIGSQVAKRATSTIPIVMALVLDPIGSGLVENLKHPGGNITGLSMMAMELYPKRLQLLKEINPQLTRAAVWWNPDHPFHPKAVEQIKAAAPSLSIELSFAAVRKPEQFAPAFSELTRANAHALYVSRRPHLLRASRDPPKSRIGGSTICHIRDETLPRRGRPLVVWGRPQRSVPSSRHLRRPNSWGREAGRPARGTADQVRARDQSRDCKSARSHYSR